MALFEAVANVVTRYKADVSDNIKGLQKIKGEERARAEALLEQHRKTNDALEAQIKGFQKVASGVVLMTAGFAAATKGLDAYAKTSDEAKAKVEKLKESSSQAFDTIFAAVGQAVTALEPLITGVSSLITLLDEVGVVAPVAIGALGFAISKNPKVAALLAAVGLAMELKDKYGKTDAIQGSVDEAMTAQGFTRDSSGFWMKTGTPAASKAPSGGGSILDGTDETGFNGDTIRKLNARIDTAIATAVSASLGLDAWSGPIDYRKGGGKGKPAPDDRKVSDFIGDVGYNQVSEATRPYALGAAADSVQRDEFGREVLPDIMAPYQKLVDAEKGRQATILEGMFGKLEEFDAYQEAFSALAGVATSAYDALVDGNMSAGAAVKAFLRDAIKGLGSRMLLRSLEEAAEGVAALSSPLTAAAAPAHFKAAGMFAGGALMAGVIASQMGGSVPSGGGAASASLPRDMGTGRDTYDGGGNKVIIIGDPMGDNTPRYMARNLNKQLNRAVRTSAGRYS